MAVFTLRSAAAPDTISDLAGLHQESVDTIPPVYVD